VYTSSLQLFYCMFLLSSSSFFFLFYFVLKSNTIFNPYYSVTVASCNLGRGGSTYWLGIWEFTVIMCVFRYFCNWLYLCCVFLLINVLFFLSFSTKKNYSTVNYFFKRKIIFLILSDIIN
jgi:hypothetical protein